MNEITISVNGKERTVIAPASWNDLDDRTFLIFYEALFHGLGDEMTAAPFTMAKLIGMTSALLNMPLPEMKAWELTAVVQHGEEYGKMVFAAELREVVHACIGGLFDIVEDDGQTTYACKLNATRNRFERIEWDYDALNRVRDKTNPKKHHLYAPTDGFGNMTIYELGFAFSLFDAYLTTKDESYIIRLIATIYRPPKSPTKENLESGYHGDIRQPLRGYESKIDFREKVCRLIPDIPKRAIIFWFASCRQVIVAQYPKVFKSRSSDSGGDNYGWGGILLKVAEMGAMGNLDNVSDQHYSNVLTFLSMKEDEAAEMERRLNKKR
jgi:hypothetical protein